MYVNRDKDFSISVTNIVNNWAQALFLPDLHLFLKIASAEYINKADQIKRKVIILDI